MNDLVLGQRFFLNIFESNLKYYFEEIIFYIFIIQHVWDKTLFIYLVEILFLVSPYQFKKYLGTLYQYKSSYISCDNQKVTNVRYDNLNE